MSKPQLPRRGSSPLARGTPGQCGEELPDQGIIPAFAGNTSSDNIGHPIQEDHPRIRGEHAHFIITNLDKLGSSPHSRGTRALFFPFPRRSRIIPAFAGNTMIVFHSPILRLGSSPHSRGTPQADFQKARKPGIIPAFAGNTAAAGGTSFSFRDHPRIRGEHSCFSGDAGGRPGSSPHSRGTLRLHAPKRHIRRIIPAFAGNTDLFTVDSTTTKDHPRIRGEHFL